MREINQTVEQILSSEANVDALVKKLHPSEIAHILSSTPSQERFNIWNNLATEIKANVVTELSEDIRVGLLEQTDINELIAATTHLDLDDLTDLLQDLPENLTTLVLQSLERQNRHQVETSLAYPEDTAGGLMNLDHIQIRADVSIDSIHRYIRKLGQLPVVTDKLMVVDRDGCFKGTLQIGKILTEKPEKNVGELMNDEAVVIRHDTHDSEVASIFQGRDLISAPVVDGENKLLGRITIDDVVDVIQENAGQTIMSRDGLAEEDDIFSPAITTAKRRNLWLGVHLLAALISAYIIGLFENSLQEIIALAILMPLIASMSGVAGSQTLTLTIRGMTLNQINGSNAKWLLIRESIVGVINGVLWGVLIAIIAYFWFNNLSISLVIIFTIILNLTLATLFGVLIPLIQRRLNIDPALAGHVVLTALTDALGFLSFLGLATIVML